MSDFTALPDYLTAQPRWLLWRTETKIDRKTGEKRARKVPISYRTRKPADVTKPDSWTDYDKVQAALERNSGAWDGAGFALGAIESLHEIIFGLDLDSCLDHDESLTEWAPPFLAAMPSYAEISPSGGGIKITARIGLTDLPEARRLLDIPEGDTDQARTRTYGERTNGHAHAPNAQLFLGKRYFTITGNHWAASPDFVAVLSLDQIGKLAALFGPKDGGPKAPDDDDDDDDETAPDEATLRDRLVKAFERNPRLKARWEGGTEGLKDDSRSARDMSIVAFLKRAGFTKGETRAALHLFEHGKITGEPARYFGEMWRRTKAEPQTEPEAPAPWKDRLQRTETGGPIPNLANAALALREAPELRGILSYDEMQRLELLSRTVPDCRMEPVTATRPLTDADVTAVQEWMQNQGLRRMGAEVVRQATALVAREHAFHPVRDYLRGLKWDGTRRIHKWLSYCLGAEPTPYTEAIGRWFLIAMVARIMRPGCKCDYMLVLEGEQGILKSTACRVLAGQWFSDSLPDLHRSDAVRLSMHLRGKWLIEIAEMASLSKADAAVLKSFITQQQERYTPKYAHQEAIEDRQCLFIGTTNKDEYLRDETGGRRFWPVKCGKIDIAALECDRDQLLAEAVSAFLAGSQWWPSRDFEQEHIKPEQEARFQGDVWDAAVEEWCAGKATCTTPEVASLAIGLDVSRITPLDVRRIAAILTRLEYRSVHSGRKRWWERKRNEFSSTH